MKLLKIITGYIFVMVISLSFLMAAENTNNSKNKFAINMDYTYDSLFGPKPEGAGSDTNFGLDIFYNKAWQLQTTTKQTGGYYNFFADYRVSVYTGLTVDYQEGVMLPIGFNYRIGHWFGLPKYKVMWSEQLNIDLNNISNIKGHWTMTFGVRYNLY